ncbi:hypothetical protein [uncultured Desulfovibrio sp.]|uniref:hypothetical protein n=1 Tax=uncultured Desulfovibrio sp. TaxID=167968 RepID=UPI0025831D03|nr:hypothetical protein [uncultured Desulfovibrio sp.]
MSDKKEKEYYVVVLDKIHKKNIWGIGESQDAAYEDCFKNLRNSWELNCWPCTKGLFDFVEKHGGSEAIDNAFITFGDIYDIKPSHDALYDFCEKYKLPEDAREELKNMLDFPIEFASNTED